MGLAIRSFADRVPGFFYPSKYYLYISPEGEYIETPYVQSHVDITNSETFSLLCTSAALPRDNVKTSQLTWNGEGVTIPLKMQSGQTWTCILTETQEGATIKSIEERLLLPYPTMHSLVVLPLNSMGEEVRTAGVIMHYAFLTNLTPTSLDSSSIHPFEWNLTFSYAYTDKYYTYYAGGTVF